MIKVTYIEFNGTERTVQVEEGMCTSTRAGSTNPPPWSLS